MADAQNVFSNILAFLPAGRVAAIAGGLAARTGVGVVASGATDAAIQGASIAAGRERDLDLGEDENNEEKKSSKKAEKEFKSVIEKIKKTLDDRVDEVRLSRRLTDSPSCLVLNETDMTPQMQQILAAAGQYAPKAQPALELNPDHELVKKLLSIGDDDAFNDWAMLLFEQADLAAGGQLEDPAEFVKRVNRLLGGND